MAGHGTKALVLEVGDGEMLWLTTNEAPLHPRAALIEGGLPRCPPGSSFKVGRCSLLPPQGPEIPFLGAQIWSPPAIEAAVPAMVVVENAEQILQSFQFTPERWVRKLKMAALLKDVRRILRLGKEIVGLGPGLTPMGDDFLGGALFGARLLAQTFGGWTWDNQELEEFLAWAKEQTTSLSGALLSDLAYGDGPEPLHELAKALFCENELGKAMVSAQELVKIGHTSGLAWLAGFCGVLSAGC